MNTQLTRIEGQEPSPEERIRKALDRYKSASVEWVAATMALARELWQARLHHVSDNAFGAWLTDNDLDDLGKDTRAALLAIGKHEKISRRVLEVTSRRSPRTIWKEEIQPQIIEAAVSQRCETSPARTSKSETPKTGVESAEEAAARAMNFHTRKVLAVVNRLKSKKFKYHLKLADLDFIQIFVTVDGEAKIEAHPRKRITVAVGSYP